MSDVSESELRVMFVDDYPEYLAAGKAYLESVDDEISVTTETCAETALDRLSREAVDCVVCDYQMPTMNGVELFESAREEYPDLPFILLTGHETERLEGGSDDPGFSVIQKGSGTHTFETLRSEIRTVVQRDAGFRFDNATG